MKLRRCRLSTRPTHGCKRHLMSWIQPTQLLRRLTDATIPNIVTIKHRKTRATSLQPSHPTEHTTHYNDLTEKISFAYQHQYLKIWLN